MLLQGFAVQRVRLLLSEIKNLKDEDFPYADSRDALAFIESRVADQLNSLEGLSPSDNADVVKAACNVSLQQLFKVLPTLGFIIRSTSVRNSFEVFGPLRRLARQILGDDAKLILSSEWLFSPHVYPLNSDLPGFVLLGFPAPESGNPLLVPLAGHELGHTTWQSYHLDQSFGPAISKHLFKLAKEREKAYSMCFERTFSDDLIDQQNLAPAYQWALRQAEESFCDFLGARLFGSSYLHAFAYLISPGGMNRIATYPSLLSRVQSLLKAANRFSFASPAGFESLFLSDITPKCTDKERFLLDLADALAAHVFDDLLQKADEIATDKSAPVYDAAKVEHIKKAFQILTPASGVGDLINILAAGWELFYDEHLWSDRRFDVDRVEVLKELVLKSIEIVEFESRMLATHDSES